jgi:glutamate synthase (NADPH) small chain
VSAIGQGGDLTGLEAFNNGKGLIDADKFYQVPGKPGHFVAGDIIRPHLLTTAIGQASIAADSIEHYLNHEEQVKRPKVDKHHFKLLASSGDRSCAGAVRSELQGDQRGTSDAVMRCTTTKTARWRRSSRTPSCSSATSPTPRAISARSTARARTRCWPLRRARRNFPETEAIAEAKRCMSCGMCFECDNCVIYCPQDAIFRVNKKEATTGRYVDTDYAKCIGCHICSDVCPTGYITVTPPYPTGPASMPRPRIGPPVSWDGSRARLTREAGER